MKIKNFNYMFAFYDVNEKRVQKVFKICKKYLTHHQYSVFRGDITPSKIIEFKKEINKVINKNEDFITFIYLKNRSGFEEETFGISSKPDIDKEILI